MNMFSIVFAITLINYSLLFTSCFALYPVLNSCNNNFKKK
uniref:Uncharacterized protein n=1 Tax=Anguilla anguilla TaxID=7936 RepID=A0A0E9QHM7_ANGAN